MIFAILIGLNIVTITGVIIHDNWKRKQYLKRLSELRKKIPAISRNAIQYAEYAYILLNEGKESEANEWAKLSEEEINKGNEIIKQINQLQWEYHETL